MAKQGPALGQVFEPFLNVLELVELMLLIARHERSDFHHPADLGELLITRFESDYFLWRGGIAQGVPAGAGGMRDQRLFPANRFKVLGLELEQIVVVTNVQG